MFKHVNTLVNLHFLNNYYVQQSFAFFVKGVFKFKIVYHNILG
jgi:hypothetical protein